VFEVLQVITDLQAIQVQLIVHLPEVIQVLLLAAVVTAVAVPVAVVPVAVRQAVAVPVAVVALVAEDKTNN